jgi:hypothetical protein
MILKLLLKQWCNSCGLDDKQYTLVYLVFFLKVQYKESQYSQRGSTAEIPMKIMRNSIVNAYFVLPTIYNLYSVLYYYQRSTPAVDNWKA